MGVYIIDGNGHLMSEITICTTLIRPLRVLPHRNLSSAGSIYCFGNNVSQVRFKVTIERYVFLSWWNIQGSNDSGWRNGRYAAAGLFASCAGGLHTYRAKGVGAMKNTVGTILYSVKYSGQRRIFCTNPD